jgi:hypothetical protein
MKKCLSILFFAGVLFVSSVIAEPLSVTGDDTIQSVLSVQKGKLVTVMLKSGVELTGRVGEVNSEVVHLMELSGKEFYDGVAAIRNIEAVVIRTKS